MAPSLLQVNTPPEVSGRWRTQIQITRAQKRRSPRLNKSESNHNAIVTVTASAQMINIGGRCALNGGNTHNSSHRREGIESSSSTFDFDTKKKNNIISPKKRRLFDSTAATSSVDDLNLYYVKSHVRIIDNLSITISQEAKSWISAFPLTLRRSIIKPNSHKLDRLIDVDDCAWPVVAIIIFHRDTHSKLRLKVIGYGCAVLKWT